ncbi:immunoglobulin superfamily DCC subclass member 4-like isoform X1 [Bufo bufo]|uniref:immunoglobulin superfamily DCC subclass member 4-like isoform X1 n=2 Tax=Bufo bufo TaxID=8384 RepID=UPI001ABE6E09|nr:immunoglobulin superfamily DCC subclass member 4-like isoform X1 [Bufo bufo]
MALSLLWGLHWAGCILLLAAGGQSTWLDLGCRPGPTDTTLLPGQEAILHCDLDDSEVSNNVTWWKDGEQLNTEDFTVLLDGSLVISQGEGASVEGSYFCSIKNSFGVLQGRTGTVRLAGLPPFHLHPEPQVVLENTLARFECGINGSPTPQITWQKDQVPLPSSSNRIIVLPSGVLQIVGVQQEDEGLYRCVAANTLSIRYSNEAQLSVKKDWKPLPDELTIIRAPQNLTVAVGQSAVMECIAEGNVTPVVSWSRQDGKPISFDIILLGETSLLIQQVQAHHAGVYVCRAKKPESQHFVAISAHLHVLVPPVITQPPETITRARAGTARFVCRAEGDPEPTITWLKNGEVLPSNGRVRIQPRGSLVITQVALEDTGYYQCVAENILGSVCAIAKLHVTVQEGLPGPPQALKSQAVTSKTVTVAWERPESNWERVVGFSLHYAKSGGLNNEEYQFAVNNNTTEFTVRYLEPGTSYTFYVVAYSQQGASRASEHLVVQTLDDVPGAAPMLALSSDGPEDLHVKWLPLLPEMRNGQITKYRIEYCTQRDGVVSTLEAGANETQVTLSSLQADTVYKVRISAATTAGYGVPSNWVLHRTLDRVNQTLVVDQAPIQLQVIAHIDSLLVSWQLPHSDFQVTGFRLYYRMVCPTANYTSLCPRQEQNEWDVGPIKLKKKRKQYDLTHLTPRQLYQVKLVAYNKKQEVQTVMWEGRTRSTLAIPPDLIDQKIPPLPPSHIQVMPNSSTSMVVKWRKPIISSKIVKYTVRCGPSATKNASLFSYHNSVSEEILIGGLKPYSRYEFAVQSSGAGVDGPYSNIVEKMTLPDRPSSAPADLVLEPLSQFSVQMHWRPPVESNGIIVQYLILYTANKSHPDGMWTVLTKDGTTFSAEVDGLQSGTKYYFKMGAKTVSGWGPYSNVVEVETLPPRLPDVLDMNSVTGIIVGVCLCLLCLLLCMCASFQQGKQGDVGSDLGPRTTRGPSSYQRARQGSCSQTHCQDSHELETLMPPAQEDTPSLSVPNLLGSHSLVLNPPTEDKNQVKVKPSWNGSVTQNWANHITSYADTITGDLTCAANGSANHMTSGGLRMALHDISYESHKMDVGKNQRNPSQNQVEADVIVHSDFSASERSGHCAGLDSEEEEELSLDPNKDQAETCLTAVPDLQTQGMVTENGSQDWSCQPLMAISTEQSLNSLTTKSQHLANGIQCARSLDFQENQAIMGLPFTVDSGGPCSEDVSLTSKGQQELPQSNTPDSLQPLNLEEIVH